jgi:hypothetical protein
VPAVATRIRTGITTKDHKAPRKQSGPGLHAAGPARNCDPRHLGAPGGGGAWQVRVGSRPQEGEERPETLRLPGLEGGESRGSRSAVSDGHTLYLVVGPAFVHRTILQSSYALIA